MVPANAKSSLDLLLMFYWQIQSQLQISITGDLETTEALTWSRYLLQHAARITIILADFQHLITLAFKKNMILCFLGLGAYGCHGDGSVDMTQSISAEMIQQSNECVLASIVQVPH
ncbi:hypothetical protein AMECASPLE_020235 [Ameca splendens]|uniref:Uncharacterized protein n=1 Tax=Ameca splendens TaxID=208324 RepID=A0ABV0XG75_9TELE